MRRTNPSLSPEVAHIFDEIEKEQPSIYWCPNTGKKYEPLIFDAPVPQNPLYGMLYRLYGVEPRGRKNKKILVWVNDSATPNWIESEHVDVDLRLPAEVVAHVHMKCLQRLQQPIKSEQGKDERRDLGVFEVCITNRHTPVRDADSYILLFSMLKSEAMVKQVFAAHRLHVHVAALVESDLRAAGESGEGIFKLLVEHRRQIGDWKYLIAPSNLKLPEWQPTDLRRDGWGHNTLHLWTRHPVAQENVPPVPLPPIPVNPDGAWDSAMKQAVENPNEEVCYTIAVLSSGRMKQPCSKFLKPLLEEERVIREHLKSFDDSGSFKVLDIGAGAGRHLACVRDNFKNALLLGTEKARWLRNNCEKQFGAKMYHSLEQMTWYGGKGIGAGELAGVLLLGNGIGLYGTQKELVAGLNDIFRMLRPGGVLIGECGSLPDSREYSEEQVVISYGKLQDRAFPWLFCRWTWLKPILEAVGFAISSDREIEQGGHLFVARKPAYPAVYWNSVLQQLAPEGAPEKPNLPALDDVLRVAQSRKARLPRGKSVQDHVRYRTAKNRVFFYPACGFDWEPLLRFSGTCDTFIYCDYGFTLEQVVDGLKNSPPYLRVEHSEVIPHDFVQAMTDDCQMPDELRRIRSVVDPWGCHCTLTSPLVEPAKRLHLLYFGVEGTTLYKNLFCSRTWPKQKRAWAPEYLCIKRDGFGFGNGWTDSREWQGPLGSLVSQNREFPKYLVTDQDHNWPWNVLWLKFPIWRGSFGGAVYVYHRPEITPTAHETRSFQPRGIPVPEWPAFCANPPYNP